ncbi:MAG: pyridoxal-phosphate dependent enzyme, partial [Nitrospinota bacterium]
MSNIYTSIEELIGNTPLVKMQKVGKGIGATILLKLESFNPFHSVKDRIGLSMIANAEREGKFQPGKTVIVEATSGNTGIGLAFVAANRGYEIIFTMPDTMSLERRM